MDDKKKYNLKRIKNYILYTLLILLCLECIFSTGWDYLSNRGIVEKRVDPAIQEQHMQDSVFVRDWLTKKSLSPSKVFSEVTRPLSKEGESYTVELSTGSYIVGKHLPEGSYTVSVLREQENESSNFIIEDKENDITYSEYVYRLKEEVPFYRDAVLTIPTASVLTLSTTNGQLEQMIEPVKNPLGNMEPIEIPIGSEGLMVGEDIKPGVYDISTNEGTCSVYIVDDTVVTYTLSSDTHGAKNLTLKEGDHISRQYLEEKEISVFISPSPFVYKSKLRSIPHYTKTLLHKKLREN